MTPKKKKIDQYAELKLIIKRRIKRMLLAPNVGVEYRRSIAEALKYNYSVDELNRLKQDISAEIRRLA
tara:strand:+ start:252 stop:455 length:204 start_codon:yes stop_codon:yes gene_type:complete